MKKGKNGMSPALDRAHEAPLAMMRLLHVAQVAGESRPGAVAFADAPA